MTESTTITLRGRAGGIPTAHHTQGGRTVVRFRLAVSTWRMRDNGQFAEGEAHWYTVRAWDKLAENVLNSVNKGDPLVVVGRPTVNAWKDPEGQVRSELVVTAQGIGHDMAFGRGRLIRPERPADQQAHEQDQQRDHHGHAAGQQAQQGSSPDLSAEDREAATEEEAADDLVADEDGVLVGASPEPAAEQGGGATPF